MRGRDLVPLVLDQMEVLDQVLPLARPVPEQGFDLVLGRGHDLPALGLRQRPLPAGPGVLKPDDLACFRTGHDVSSIGGRLRPGPYRSPYRGSRASRQPLVYNTPKE